MKNPLFVQCLQFLRALQAAEHPAADLEPDGAVCSQVFAASPPAVAEGPLQAPLEERDFVVPNTSPSTAGLRKLAMESGGSSPHPGM